MPNETIVTALFAALVLGVQHWFPWQKIMRAPLPRLVAYIMGTLALTGPLTVLAIVTEQTVMAVAIPFVTTVGGLTVILAYGIDDAINRLAEWRAEHDVRDVV
jgi:hypothetical protein